ELREAGVQLRLETRVTAVTQGADNSLRATLQPKDGEPEQLACRYVFNCTYSGLNQLKGDFPGTQMGLKHEVTEMALLRVPDALGERGITVMDGPFFSIMPFPARGLHTLSHVRYTPHQHWADEAGLDPYARLSE